MVNHSTTQVYKLWQQNFFVKIYPYGIFRFLDDITAVKLHSFYI